MDLNLENNNPNINRGRIIYHESLIDDLQSYLKQNVERLYQDPAEIIEKKEKFLEQKQINSDNFQRLRDQVANSEQLKEQLIEEQEKNRILNSYKNNQDLVIQEQEQQLKNLNASNISIPSENISSGDFPNNQIAPGVNNIPKTEYQQLMEKINLLINNINNKPSGQPFSSNIFDEHNKLLLNKRMSDIDEKLYDLTRKLNNKESNYPNPYPIYPYVPPNFGMTPNPFLQVPTIEKEISKVQEPVIHPDNHSFSNPLGSSTFKEIGKTPSKSPNSEQDKYNSLEERIKELNSKYKELSLKKDEHNPHNMSPITVNINNDHDSLREQPEISEKSQESQPRFSDNEEEDINYKFGKITNPFDYIYNNTDDIIFEKKPVLLSGGKLEKFKKMRKLKKK